MSQQADPVEVMARAIYQKHNFLIGRAELETALSALQSAGLKVLPREATEAMVTAMWYATEKVVPSEEIKEIWRAGWDDWLTVAEGQQGMVPGRPGPEPEAGSETAG